MEYIVANPSGNITVLVTTDVAKENRASVVKEIFEKVPTCEQVGFVAVVNDRTISLEMMGGEFCGNATLSTAAYLATINNLEVGHNETYKVLALGVDKEVMVSVTRLSENEFTGSLEMPKPYMDYYEGRPVVMLDGISHMIIPDGSFTGDELEAMIRPIAEKMNVPALGIIQYKEENESVSIVPLVYVRNSNTCVWENGCASGSIAAAYYRFVQNEENRVTAVSQPGGIITVEIREDSVILSGKVVLGNN